MTNNDEKRLKEKAKRLRHVGVEATKNTIEKNRKYGDAVRKVGAILRILYPDEIQPCQYDNSLLLIRLLDKVVRIASYTPERIEADDENPWVDVAGYGLLGAELFLVLEELGLEPGEYEI